MPDNHAILLTGSGLAAIAGIRLSGPAVPAFLQKHFSRPAKLGRCVHGNLIDGSRTIDDPVIVLISPTAADINLHGSPWIIRSTFDLARSNGFEVAEYSVDAAAFDVPEGRNLLWQEVLQSLPRARTEQAVRILLAQPAAWEDLVERMERGSISAREIQGIQNDRSLHWMLSLPRVAIIGPPNVGKSTLANRLFGQDRSIMADIPGTTRDWVGEIANIDGLAVTLIDTAGRRHTLDPIEAAAIAAGSAEAITADLIILVLDHSAALDSHTHDLIDSYPEALIVANKSDRPPAWNAVDLNSVTTVALTQMGMDTLRQKIRRYFGCDDEESGRPRWWTQRQRDFLTGSLMGAK